jgi:hypothetical protein
MSMHVPLTPTVAYYSPLLELGLLPTIPEGPRSAKKENAIEMRLTFAWKRDEGNQVTKSRWTVF